MAENAKLEKLKKDLALAEKGIVSEQIKNNPKLKGSLETKISILKTQIGIEERGGKSKVEAGKTIAKPAEKKADAKAPASKPAAVKKEKKVVAKSDKPHAVTSHGGRKVGDEVKFIERKTGKTLKGEIARIYKSYHSDKYIAVVNCDDKRREVYLTKLL